MKGPNGVSIFDILGPVMIGPSSSHTAGAVRLARAARAVYGAPAEPAHTDTAPEADAPAEDIPADGAALEHVEFLLHGSFARTYRGHGTDKALVAGILGLLPDDERIRNAFDLATERGFTYDFIPTDLGYCHENTVGFRFFRSVPGTGFGGGVSKTQLAYVQGSSVGGGAILLTHIGEYEVSISCALPTILIHHEDKPGAVGKVTMELGKQHINIAAMKVSRQKRGDLAFMTIETDEAVPDAIAESLRRLDGIRDARVIPAI